MVKEVLWAIFNNLVNYLIFEIVTILHLILISEMRKVGVKGKFFYYFDAVLQIN